MRVLSAKNWVGFIQRARDEMTPKVIKFCNQREQFLQHPLDPSLARTDQYDTDFDPTIESLKAMDFNS